MHTYIYIYTLFHHRELTSVFLHRWPSFTTLGKPTIWVVTYLSSPYTPTCTHKYTVCFTDNPPSYTHIYIYIYIYIYTMFHHTELSICFTAQIAHHHAYVYIYALFHHTELTSVLPHRWPSFTTLEKPTIWMVTYLSPSYTPICTHIHTVCFTDSPPSYIHIYIHMYSVSPHKVTYLFYRTDIPPSCIYIYSLFHHTELTCVLPHRCPSFTTLGKPTIWMVTYLSPSYKPICTHIYTVCFTDIPLSYIYIHIYILCFTTQSWVSVLPHR